MTAARHWDDVYRTKAMTTVSWFQTEAARSVQLITTHAPARTSRIIDVGAGASPLVDGLLHEGYADITLLDIAEPALALTRTRLGAAAAGIRTLAADVLDAPLPPAGYDVWHDRAVFHFLTSAPDRDRYLAQLRHALAPDGVVILATFADDGPERCSGLPVARYSVDALTDVLGLGFRVLATEREAHQTPGGSLQSFTWLAAKRTGR